MVIVAKRHLRRRLHFFEIAARGRVDTMDILSLLGGVTPLFRRKDSASPPERTAEDRGMRAVAKRRKTRAVTRAVSAPAAPPTLAGLPLDLVVYLCAFLDLPSLCRLGATGRALRQTIVVECGRRLREVDPFGALTRDISSSIAASSVFGPRNLVLALADRCCFQCGAPTLYFFAPMNRRLCQSCFAKGTCSRDCPECRADETPGETSATDEEDPERDFLESPDAHSDFLSGLLHRAEMHKFDIVERSAAMYAYRLDDEDLDGLVEIKTGLLRWHRSSEVYSRMLDKWGSVDALRAAWTLRRRSLADGSLPSSPMRPSKSLPPDSVVFPVLGRDARTDAQMGYTIVMNQFFFSTKPDYIVVSDEAQYASLANHYQCKVVDSVGRAVAMADPGSTILIPRGSFIQVADPIEIWRGGLRIRGESREEYRARAAAAASKETDLEAPARLNPLARLLDTIFGAPPGVGKVRQAPSPIMPPPAHLHCRANATMILSRPTALENLVITSGVLTSRGVTIEDDFCRRREDFGRHFPHARPARGNDVDEDDFFSALTIDTATFLRQCRVSAERGSSVVGRNFAQLDVMDCEFVNARCAGICLTGSARLANFKANVLTGNGTWGLQAARALDNSHIFALNTVAGNDLGNAYI